MTCKIELDRDAVRGSLGAGCTCSLMAQLVSKPYKEFIAETVH